MPGIESQRDNVVDLNARRAEKAQDVLAPQARQVALDTDELANGVIDLNSPNFPQEHPEAYARHVVRQLETAVGSEGRVRVFAEITDRWGLDAALSFFFPSIGDAAVSSVGATYLLGEAYRAGLSKSDAGRIAFYQLVDFAIGNVPLAGDIADYFWKANMKSAKLFEARRAELVAEALKAGVSQTEIDQILQSADSLGKMADKAIQVGEILTPPVKKAA